MKLTADALIELPFKLDFCCQKPNVDPLTLRLDATDITLWFPPSMSDGTDGLGIIGGWAWWTGKTLRIVQEREIPQIYDSEALRESALSTGNEVLRRFLNSYRWRFHRPDVHPIGIDVRTLNLEVTRDDGSTEKLLEPFSAFFYKNMPAEPPLEASVNPNTLATLHDDIQQDISPPLDDQLRLDTEAIEAQGDHRRAALIRSLIGGS